MSTVIETTVEDLILIFEDEFSTPCTLCGDEAVWRLRCVTAECAFNRKNCFICAKCRSAEIRRFSPSGIECNCETCGVNGPNWVDIRVSIPL